MKKIVLVVMILFSLPRADHIRWMGSYDQALSQAKQSHKKLIVLLVKPDCLLCNKVIRDVFMNQPYIQEINSRFISVIVTYEGRTSYPIEMYYSTEFPTLFFVDSATEHLLEKPLYGTTITQKSLNATLPHIHKKKQLDGY